MKKKILALAAAVAAALGLGVVAAPQASALQTGYVRSYTCPIPGTFFMNNSGQVNSNAVGTITIKVGWSQTLNADGVVIEHPGDQFGVLTVDTIRMQNNTDRHDVRLIKATYQKLAQGQTNVYDVIATADTAGGGTGAGVPNSAQGAAQPSLSTGFIVNGATWNFPSLTNHQSPAFDPNNQRFGRWTAMSQDPVMAFGFDNLGGGPATASCWTHGDGVNNG